MKLNAKTMRCGLLFIIFLSLPLSAEKLSLSGYFKSFFMAFKMPPVVIAGETINQPAIGAVNNRLRLKLVWKPSQTINFKISYDFSPRVQDRTLFLGDIFYQAVEPGSYRAWDFKERIYPGDNKSIGSFGLFHNLDRCVLTVKTPLADIFIGRQAIAWGSARFVNPTDVIAPFTFNALDTEESRGVDAVRVRVPLGMMAELDAGYVAGNDFEFKRSAFFLRGKMYVLKTDVSIILLGFKENLLLGFDIARSIGGAGFWLEAAYVIPGFFEKDTPADEKDYFRASTGMDYNFNAKLYGFFEYHFNSAGKTDPAHYSEFYTSTAYREGSTYLAARHYLNLGLTYQVTPLIPFTGMLFYNITDGSFNLAPSLEYNIAENIYLSLGAYLGIGKTMKTTPGTEFGSYPDMIYTSFRVYF